jgi:hypothetical protein
MTIKRHHTDAEYDELKAKLDHANRRIEELCLWGRAGEYERIELRAEVERLRKWKPHCYNILGRQPYPNRCHGMLENLLSRSIHHRCKKCPYFLDELELKRLDKEE